MLTASQFLAMYPAFANANSSRVDFHLRVAGLRLSESLYGDMYDDAVALFVAHHLALENASPTGKVVGQITAKGVDKVTVSYDVANVSLTDAGHWNSTAYGIQFFQMARMFGMGGIQL